MSPLLTKPNKQPNPARRRLRWALNALCIWVLGWLLMPMWHQIGHDSSDHRHLPGGGLVWGSQDTPDSPEQEQNNTPLEHGQGSLGHGGVAALWSMPQTHPCVTWVVEHFVEHPPIRAIFGHGAPVLPNARAPPAA